MRRWVAAKKRLTAAASFSSLLRAKSKSVAPQAHAPPSRSSVAVPRVPRPSQQAANIVNMSALKEMPLRVWFGFACFLWHDAERPTAMRCMRALLDVHGGANGANGGPGGTGGACGSAPSPPASTRMGTLSMKLSSDTGLPMTRVR